MPKKKRDLGLDAKDPRDHSPLFRCLGMKEFIPEGEDTFRALVPDRYKKKEEEDAK